MITGQLLINGQWVEGKGEALSSVNPATDDLIWQSFTATPDQVRDAVVAARAAFPAWASLPRAARIEVLRRYQAHVKTRVEDIAQALSRESGKALWETRIEAAGLANKVEVSIRAYDERTGERESKTGFGRAILRHRPHGVCAVLGPYNFPCHLPNGHIVPALLAGDTVVFKPSEETPWSGQILIECLQAAEFPAGVINLVQGGREVGAALLDQDIDALLFTGSAAAGAHFKRKFADNPHVLLALELGGNNPLVVWDVDDIDAAATHVIQSAYVTTGQRCSCARRLIVQDSLFDPLSRAIADLTAKLIIAPWDHDPEPYMGPLISARVAAGAQTRVSDLITRGAKPILPFGTVGELPEAFVSPALLDIRTAQDLPDEEIFAPILQIDTAPDFETAVKKANATRYGLSAGLVSDRASHWQAFIHTIRAGVVNWNRPTTGAAADMPFGGLGASGNHRPSAYYAADYCAYPVASFEADQALSVLSEMKGIRA